jgi:glycine oxidase
LASALALADAGFEVTVCDPSPASSASAVAAGMLAPVFEAVLDEAAPPLALMLAARDRWPALEARAGVRLERSGALAAGGADWTAGVAAAIGRLGLHAVDVPRKTALALAPGLSEAVEAVVLSREDWRLDPRAALAALRAAAEAAGVAFRPEPATGRGSADLLVIATGADRSLEAVAAELGSLSSVKGHILHAPVEGQSFVAVRGQGGYVSPVGGGLAVGATMEAGVDDPRPDPQKAAPLLAAGAALFPALAGARPQLLAGLRGATPDGLPLAGFGREPGVLLAVGARRNGWLLAPLVAQVVAALATDSDPGPWARAFDPQRFALGAA